MKIPYLLLLVAGLVIAVAVLAFAFLPNATQPTPTTTQETPATTDGDQTPSGGLSIRQPDEKNIYNMGTTETVTAKDGSSVNVYTNNQLGISFSYPPAFGDIKATNNDDQILFAFVDPETENATTFMALYKQQPAGRGSYWGDIGSGVTSENLATFCTTQTGGGWTGTPTCETAKTKNGYDFAHVTGVWSMLGSTPENISVFVIPQKTDIYSDATVSDAELIEGGEGTNAETIIASIVDSLTFSPLQPIYY